MGLLSRVAAGIGRLFARPGGSAPAGKPARGSWLGQRQVAARYDAAQTTPANRGHWANADALSANASNSPQVRSTLRNRARYEVANSPHLKGLLRTVRNDVVGTGPRLQLTLPETFTDPDFGTRMDTPAGAARAVERQFRRWGEAAGLADELRVMVESGDRDGEVFGLTVTNPAIDDAVKLALRAVEADQCTTPDIKWNDPTAVDGIRFDQWGNPSEYHFLKAHPGDAAGFNPWDYERVPARYVAHWFDADRPGQRRGIPTITPSLPLYAQLRRFTQAVLSAAETAARHAAVLYSDQPPPGDLDGTAPAEELPENFDQVPLPPPGAGATLPAGWKLEQLKPEQPTTTFPQFQSLLLTEGGAAIGAPQNVSTKSSAAYNYSSARLDHLPYRQGIRIARDRLRRVVLEKLFRAWLKEALLVPGYLPAGLPPVDLWDVAFNWDGFESIDPVKDATADQLNLANGLDTLARQAASRGADWEEDARQRAREVALYRELGLPLPAGVTSVVMNDKEPADAAA